MAKITFLEGFTFEGEDGFVSLNEVSEACNAYRLSEGLKHRPLGNVVGTTVFKEFVKEVERELAVDQGYRIEGSGRNRKTMAHYAVAAYVIGEYSVVLRAKLSRRGVTFED